MIQVAKQSLILKKRFRLTMIRLYESEYARMENKNRNTNQTDSRILHRTRQVSYNFSLFSRHRVLESLLL